MRGPNLLKLIGLTEILFFVCLCEAEEFKVNNTDVHERDESQASFNEMASDDADAEFEFLLKWKNNPCKSYNSKKPNFHLPGLRISEAKCLEYIWEVEEEEELARRADDCKRMTGFVGVTGGRSARPQEFPHMGAVGWKAKDVRVPWLFLCGSFLINEYFVVTAAHCQSACDNKRVRKPHPEIVRFGVENVYRDENEPLDITISKFIPHSKYDPPKQYFDIALIRLSKRVKFNSFVRPACLWRHNIKEVKNATVAGWGVTNPDPVSIPQTISPHLQVAEVNIIDSPHCDDMLYQKQNARWKGVYKQMCAINLVNSADTCHGDSGGPLQVKLTTTTKHPIYSVIGVTSFGFGCGKKSFPSIYTKVSSFIDWIENEAWRGKLPQKNKIKWRNLKNNTPRAKQI